MMDFLEVLHQLLNEGITWSSAIAIVLAFLKISEGRHKRKVYEATRADIKAIKEHLGCHVIISETSLHRGPMKNVRWSSQPWAALYRAVPVKQFIILRRKSMKPNPINPFTLTLAILGAGKMILESFGVDLIDDNQINDIANGVAAVVTIVGVVMSHRRVKVKEVVTNGQSTFTVPTESTK